MTQRDFNYWLQGLFELSGSQLVLSVRQLVLIRKHLELVATSGPVSPFGVWLFGCLDTLKASGVLDLEPAIQVEAKVSRMIEERLSKEFVHVIDHGEKVA